MLSKRQNRHRLYPWFLKSKFFGRRRVWAAPFWTLVLCFQIICKAPALVTSNYSVQKVWVAFDRFNKVVSVIKALSFLFGCEGCGTNHTQSFRFCKSSRKVCCVIVFIIPIHSSMSLHKGWRSSFKIWLHEQCFHTFLLSFFFRFSAHHESTLAPSKNVLYQQNTVARCTADSP